MLEITIGLIVGFALGYGVREWISQQRRRAVRQSLTFSGAPFHFEPPKVEWSGR
jgi:hypothetical protein